MTGMPYQSFKQGEGSSDSAGKLQAIRLPKLQGKRFLDLGCNAGFFCKYALDQGASRVVGVDKTSHYIKTAQNQFPEASFICSDWSNLELEGEFDVIIILSALHYATDTSALLKKVHKLLSKDGVFVFEGGYFPTISTPFGFLSHVGSARRGIQQKHYRKEPCSRISPSVGSGRVSRKKATPCRG